MKKSLLVFAALVFANSAFATDSYPSEDLKTKVNCAVQVERELGDQESLQGTWIDTAWFGSGFKVSGEIDNMQIEALAILMPYQGPGISALTNMELSIQSKNSDENLFAKADMAAVTEGPKSANLVVSKNKKLIKFNCYLN